MAEADKPVRKSADKARDASAASVDEILRLAQQGGGSTAEALSAALLAALGSGPGASAGQGLAAASQASGAMFHNAVSNQQMTNILGMVATANCVQALLGREPNIPWPDLPLHTGEAE